MQIPKTSINHILEPIDATLYVNPYFIVSPSVSSYAKHQVRSIYDLENDETSYLLYTPEGQLQTIIRPCTGDIRSHRWTEAGQLLLSIDNNRSGFYGYDSNGERVYKLTGTSLSEQYNAGEQQYTMLLDDATMYVNPYFIVTPKGYTKHIYNGRQRIATHLGKEELSSCIDTTAAGRERLRNARAYMQNVLSQTDEFQIDDTEIFVDIEGDDYEELQWQCLDYDEIVNDIEVICDSDMLLPTIMYGDATITDRYPIYLYHTDHLGSATWITDYYGNVRQFLHYMPYGEFFLNQQTSHYNERFKFTGKERDTETNYDYFGARFYSPDIAGWLSPDPLSDKYPSISPYAYCNWNPVKYVDPDGEDELEIHWNENKENIKVNVLKNSEYDQIHILDLEGKTISSNKFLFGTIHNPRWSNYHNHKIFYFDVSGDENADKIFEFLGTNFTYSKNMPLEWSRVKIGYPGSGRNIVGTSMEKSSTIVGHFILDNNYTIRGVDHNHPKGLNPSKTDLINGTDYTSKFPKALLRVYTGSEYITYSTLIIPTIEITGNNK